MSDGATAFEAENVSVYFDLSARQALPMPEDLRAALNRLSEEDGNDA